MKTNQNNNRLGSIESTINAIENNLVRNAAAGLSVERKKAGNGQACKCMINIFAEEKPKGKDDRKPLLTYAFYAGTYFPSRLGSVAIYADNVTAILAQIRASKTLFGIPVVEATLECGRRPFIDVRFAA
ncbi:MAG: hypothetical protein K2L11_00380 [Muribaculaceae bacterium]|nr:hypothetical protein [Muribaculaceae bacterium]